MSNDKKNQNLEQNKDDLIKLEEDKRKEKVKTIVEDIKEIDLKEIDNPFELILLLIEKANSLKEEPVDILNFKLSDITSDYIKIMEHMEEIDMEVAADFILIEATLIKIKSEMLLPKPDIESFDEDEKDAETRILRATKEYEIFRNTAQKLSQIEDYNKRYRDPAPFSNNYRIVLRQMSIDSLINAFAHIMEQSVIRENQPVQTIVKDRWTVEDKMFEIETLLFDKDRLYFFDLIDDDFTRGEIINLFLALLELVRKDQITVQQNETYGDIIIYKVQHNQDDLEEYNYVEEFED